MLTVSVSTYSTVQPPNPLRRGGWRHWTPFRGQRAPGPSGSSELPEWYAWEVSSISALSKLYPYSLKDDRKSKESPALAAQLRAFSVISSSLRAELSTSRNHSVGKVSAFADESSDRSHPLTRCQRYCRRRRFLRHRPLPQCLSGRGSFIHASQAWWPEKRGSPLPWAGHARTPLRFCSIASAPDLPKR